MEGTPRRGAEDPRVRRRPAAALAHGEVRNGHQGRVCALDDRLRRDVELGGVRGVRGRSARRRRGRGGGRRVQLRGEQGSERRRVRQPRRFVRDETGDRGREGLGRLRRLDLEVEEGGGLFVAVVVVGFGGRAVEAEVAAVAEVELRKRKRESRSVERSRESSQGESLRAIVRRMRQVETRKIGSKRALVSLSSSSSTMSCASIAYIGLGGDAGGEAERRDGQQEARRMHFDVEFFSFFLVECERGNGDDDVVFFFSPLVFLSLPLSCFFLFLFYKGGLARSGGGSPGALFSSRTRINLGDNKRGYVESQREKKRWWMACFGQKRFFCFVFFFWSKSFSLGLSRRNPVFLYSKAELARVELLFIIAHAKVEECKEFKLEVENQKIKDRKNNPRKGERERAFAPPALSLSLSLSPSLSLHLRAQSRRPRRGCETRGLRKRQSHLRRRGRRITLLPSKFSSRRRRSRRRSHCRLNDPFAKLGRHRRRHRRKPLVVLNGGWIARGGTRLAALPLPLLRLRSDGGDRRR